MKNIALSILVIAGLMMTGCGEDTEAVKSAVKAKADRAVELAEMQANLVADKAAWAQEIIEEKAALAKAEAEALAKKIADEAAAKKAAAQKAAEEAAKALEAKAEAASISTQEAATVVAETTSDVVDAVKETATNVVDAVMGNAAGESAYASCKGCHGADGTTKALGKAAPVAGQSAADLEAALLAYKAGTRNVVGLGAMMKGQVVSMSDEDIKAVSEYISGL